MNPCHVIRGREPYRAFCRKAAPSSLFFQDWWLDALDAGGHWDAFVVADAGGAALAALPVFVRRRWGIPFLTLPPSTPYLGLCFPPPPAGEPPAARLLRERRAADALIPHLRRHVYVRLKMHPEFQDWLPFYWAGFRQTTRYVQVVDLRGDPAAYLATLRPSVRRTLGKASRKLVVVGEAGPGALYAMVAATYRRQGRRPPLPPAAYERWRQALARHTAIRTYFAIRPETGAVCGAVLTAAYRGTAYALAMGQDYAIAPPGTGTLLLWSAIRDAFGENRQFNCCGSMMPGVHEFLAGFNPELVGYSMIERGPVQWLCGNKSIR